MNNFQHFNNLNFDRTINRIPRRLIPTIGIPIGFSILWHFASPSTTFWFLFFSLAILSWAASYGWRQALTSLIDMLQQVAQL
ncbi:MAG: hypothetical protein PVF83_14060 [Anaerolineales bacterium]|jgi:hypothetical protein